jgi:hypothetical protein
VSLISLNELWGVILVFPGGDWRKRLFDLLSHGGRASLLRCFNLCAFKWVRVAGEKFAGMRLIALYSSAVVGLIDSRRRHLPRGGFAFVELWWKFVGAVKVSTIKGRY